MYKGRTPVIAPRLPRAQPRVLHSVCVYCGARTGDDPRFAAAARRLADLLAAHGVRLVYGASSIGLMGVLAEQMIAQGGAVTGIIPRHLDTAEVTNRAVQELVLVNSMHERKKLMFDRSDAFVILPGGFGTLDELVEVVTWAQLGLHDKPIILVNQHDYWRPLLDLIGHLIDKGFAAPETGRLIRVVDDVDDAIAAALETGGGARTAFSELF